MYPFSQTIKLTKVGWMRVKSNNRINVAGLSFLLIKSDELTSSASATRHPLPAVPPPCTHLLNTLHVYFLCELLH